MSRTESIEAKEVSSRASFAAERALIDSALRAEAEAVQRLIESVGDEIHEAIDVLDGCGQHIVTTGMGKSGIIAQKMSATFSSLGAPSHFIHPAEATHGDLGRVRRGDVVLALSYSGNTDEVVVLATLLKTDGVPIVTISSNPSSRLAALSDVHLSIGAVSEACPLNLAPTASTTAMLALGDALALAVSRRRNFTADDFHKRHPGGMLGLGLRPITQILRFEVGKNLPLIPESATVRSALQIGQDGRRPGALVVIDERGRMTGIFTDGDLRRLVIRDQSALDRSIADVMTRSPRHLTVDSLVRDTVQLIREHRQDEIPVVDHDGRPVGLVDVQDLISLKIIED